MTVEYFPELGGTKTLGRVSGYYWGYKETALYRQTEEGIKAQSALLGGKSRICAMMFYLRKQATQKNGKLQTNSIICGVTKEGDRVTGIVVEADSAADDLYVAAISRDTKTYTASGITLKVGLLLD